MIRKESVRFEEIILIRTVLIAFSLFRQLILSYKILYRMKFQKIIGEDLTHI